MGDVIHRRVGYGFVWFHLKIIPLAPNRSGSACEKAQTLQRELDVIDASIGVGPRGSGRCSKMWTIVCKTTKHFYRFSLSFLVEVVRKW